MKKRLIGGTVVILAGIGIYRLAKERFDQSQSGEENWTTANMPDLAGKVIIVTGANSGIGFIAAKEFARQGAQTIMACRSIEKAGAARDEIMAEIPWANLEIMALDLANLASVRQFAADFQEKYQQLDILVNNAGIMMVPYGTTADGFERQLGTNHLGHFALTGLLFNLLRDTSHSRVVNVSSGGHRFGKMDFDDLQFADGNGYSPASAYGRSKLANLLFTKELGRRFDALGIDSLALSAHPGTAETNLARHMEDEWYFKAFRPVFERMVQSAAMGALPTLRAAVDSQAQPGDYFGPNGLMEQRGFPVLVQPSAAAQNDADALRLWQESEALTGISFASLADGVKVS